MSDNGDNGTDKIIHEFLDLWQKQFSYLTKDPETVANMLAMYAQAQEQYFNSTNKENDVKPGTDSNIHDNADDELCQLRKRIAGLEKRVAELESGSGGKGKKSAGKNSGKKPTGTGTGTAKTAK